MRSRGLWQPLTHRRLAAFAGAAAIASVVTLAARTAFAPELQGAAGNESAATPLARGDTPLNLAETPDGFLISTNNGYGKQYLLAYDEARRRISDQLPLPGLWYGLEVAPGGGGATPEPAKESTVLASDGQHSVLAVPFKAAKFGRPVPIALEGCEMTAGLTVVSGSTALVACTESKMVVEFDFANGRVLKRSQVGEYPYAVKALPGNRVAVSDWGQSSVDILDASTLRRLSRISVGSHPSDMMVMPGRGELLAACADADLISVIDLKTLKEVRRIDIRLPDSKLGGAQPDALALDPASGKVYAALAALNALAAFDFGKDEDSEVKFEGLIPVGPYPTALLYSTRARTLFIADGRNAVQGPNTPEVAKFRLDDKERAYRSGSGSALAYIGYLIGGGIEGIAEADFARLGSRMTNLATEVYGYRRQLPDAQTLQMRDYFSLAENSEAPIRHVIYVIKENRTYDQVLGDLPEGNGEAGLVLFGESVTPNQHALARQFVLLDNFFVDGDVSADGHLWSTAASSSDYVNKVWPSVYSHRFKFDFWGSGYDGDESHDRPIAGPSSGFIWDRAWAAGVTYRVYGEMCVDSKTAPGTTEAFLRGLKGHIDSRYVDGIGAVTDRDRMAEWEREFHEFEQNGKLPQLTVMHLPNDHTRGTQAGRFTPRAMVADNDQALGRLVEVVSGSRYWASTAIFVLEDDAQDGPDHVDAHRSLLFVVSPYVRHGLVEHARFSTVSVLKTIEQLLGLSSLTYFDDRAPSLLADFQKDPALQPFNSRPAGVSLDERNPPQAPGAKESARWDFTRPDAAPEQELNQVIWKSVKGARSEPPAPVFSVASAGLGR